jgi:hypothetical protein
MDGRRAQKKSLTCCVGVVREIMEDPQAIFKGDQNYIVN